MINAKRALFGITQAMRGSRSLNILREIRSAPFASREQVVANQFARLSSLLAVAELHVPYYRQMFSKLGIHSRDIRCVADLAMLPVLTKDIIREHLGEFVREDVLKDELIRGNSGGSTGVPLTFYRDRSVLDAADAGTFRNLLQSGWTPGDMIAFFWGWDNQLQAMPRFEFELRQRVRRQYQFDPFQSRPEEMDRWIEKYRVIKPRVVLGYASTVARFAAHVEARGQALRPVMGVYTTAEKLYLPQRQTISRVFCCPVYDCYGSAEVSNVASECRHGRMHVNADFVVLEVDRKGVAKGESAPFIVTGLWNRTMPFIRYRNEDCGELLDEVCDCSNNFPLMQLNIARVSDTFVLPDGKVVHGEYLTHLMYGKEGIAMFQFHQTSTDSITLWVVPGPGRSDACETSVRLVVEQVERLDSLRRLKVQVRQTDAIPLTGAGKHRFTRSDVGLPTRN